MEKIFNIILLISLQSKNARIPIIRVTCMGSGLVSTNSPFSKAPPFGPGAVGSLQLFLDECFTLGVFRYISFI